MLLFYISIYNGGRGRAGAGKKGRRCYFYIYTYIMEEGAEREPGGGEDEESIISL